MKNCPRFWWPKQAQAHFYTKDEASHDNEKENGKATEVLKKMETLEVVIDKKLGICT